MNTKTATTTTTDTTTRSLQLEVARAIAAGDTDGFLGTLYRIRAMKQREGRAGWLAMLSKFDKFLATGRPEFSVFVEGNEKLPFLAFSSLAIATCPGAGACADYCYSLRAWRYPAAWLRQVQNAIMMRTPAGRAQILAALDKELNKKKYAGRRVDLRLYVDGDFSTTEDVAFWMGALAERPEVAAYGYSKSWPELLEHDRQTGGEWPENYVLNVSSGGRWDTSPAIKGAVTALPITRGEFVAVDIGRHVRAVDFKDPDYRRDVRKAYGGKSFPCPGRCGECTGAGHACGIKSINVPIIIGIH